MPQMDCSALAINTNQHADEEVVHQTKDAQVRGPIVDSNSNSTSLTVGINLGIVISG
jgi:hypothetical protein